MAELRSFTGNPPKVIEGDLWVTGEIFGSIGAARTSNGYGERFVSVGSTPSSGQGNDGDIFYVV
jgi:hypothetical protein